MCFRAVKGMDLVNVSVQKGLKKGTDTKKRSATQKKRVKKVLEEF